MGMKDYFVNKLLTMIITLFAVVCINFYIFRIMPGSPELMMADPRLGEEHLIWIREKFGFDKPLWMQFILYLRELFSGNLGISYWYKNPVMDIIAYRLKNTILLVGSATILSTGLGIILGSYSGWKRGTKIDSGILSFSLIVSMIPTFWVGIMLQMIFAYWFRFFPFGGMITLATEFSSFEAFRNILWHMALPMIAGLFWHLGSVLLLTRSSMLDVLTEDYITTAKAKGLKESLILKDHAIRNALLPIITVIAINLGRIVAGAVQTETVFSWPGIGRLIYDSIIMRDYPLLQGTFLVIAVSVILANFLADIAYGYFDPRVRVGTTSFDGGGIVDRILKDKGKTSRRRFLEFLREFRKKVTGILGLFIIICFVFIALFAPVLSSHDPLKLGKFEDILRPPSSRFLLGTDTLGRDVLSQLLYGSRISIIIALVVSVISITIGSAVGLISGFYGGKVDEIIMRFVDILMVIPFLPLMIVLAAVLGPNIWNIILVLGILGWPRTARIVRSQVISIKERTFVEASKSIGASNVALMIGEILPNVVPIIFAQTMLTMAGAIYSEATLSFLGLGDPSKVTWGMMLHNAFRSGVMHTSWWWSIPPGVAIASLVLGYTFLGSAINEVLNPRYRTR